MDLPQKQTVLPPIPPRNLEQILPKKWKRINDQYVNTESQEEEKKETVWKGYHAPIAFTDEVLDSDWDCSGFLAHTGSSLIKTGNVYGTIVSNSTALPIYALDDVYPAAYITKNGDTIKVEYTIKFDSVTPEELDEGFEE